ncbi:MAG: LysR family transcriptional regulator [Gammaproteobacteria bacterium]|nr:LysR family transcriptional regulator [Gammaproteobacteria bacterium]
MHRPTFRQLQIFSTVAKHHSFTRAAEELFLTQSSVSTQLKQLTELIGHPLWEQIGKKIFLTPVGERVFLLGKELDQNWKSFEDDMAMINNPNQGKIVVSCVNTCQYFIPRIIGLFYQQYPNIEIVFKVFNRRRIMDRISQNLDDLYIMDYISDDIDVRAVPFVDNPLVVLAHPSHPLAKQHNIELKAIEHELFLVREPGSGTRRETDLFFAANHINNPVSIEMGSNEAIKQGILGGLGISVLSLYTSVLEIKLGILTMLDIKGFPVMKKWNIAYPNGKVLKPVVRTFLEFLKNDGRTIASSIIENVPLTTSRKTPKKSIRKLTPTPELIPE